jgi:hypothetical protein
MIFEVIVLLLAIPTGYLIAYWANDELVSGRKWFKIIFVLCILLGIIFSFFADWTVVLSLGFILVVSGISLWKSFDKNWTKRRV